MEGVLEIFKRIVEFISVIGILTVIITTILGWLYYDFSSSLSTLTAEETLGLFLFSLIVVFVIRTIIYVKSNTKTK